MPGLADLLDSDMESNHFIDENSIISSASDTTTLAPSKQTGTKKAKKRKCVTMPKKTRTTKAASGDVVKPAGKQQLAGAKRKKPVAEPIPQDEETVEISQCEYEAEVDHKSRGRQAVRNKTSKKMNTTGIMGDEVVEVETTIARSNHAQSKSAKSAPKVITSQKSQAKQTKSRQQPALESRPELVSENGESDDEHDFASQQPPVKRARTESRIRQEPSYRRRAGSASDTERGDPNLRRKLGDVTRKFENIDLKYRNLKEVGVVEANANVEKLRKQCEATAEASNKLVASLKKELELQAPLVRDSRKLKKDLQTYETEMSKLHSTNSELTASLSSAQNEIKALQAKLAAARSSSVVSEIKAPGSARKPNMITKTAGAAGLDSSTASQDAQLKLDLYGDLTGLIIRSVKQAEDGETYDCIQTGRNGTLHFKLFIDQEDAKNASFDETEFLYTPLLDANRDRDMIELMPAYLTEDITFARQNAAKFYGRVVDTLTKRKTDD